MIEKAMRVESPARTVPLACARSTALATSRIMRDATSSCQILASSGNIRLSDSTIRNAADKRASPPDETARWRSVGISSSIDPSKVACAVSRPSRFVEINWRAAARNSSS
ncbi:hypothetical protein G6F50_016711 [Rhizopus delemar]|uniref:Uncharacterized protein n=1 Tax=Rhizopus delemar TaxID=936053 RepID=A0A9P6XS88_9FUNG|nr:hypothetical protein G6F50_016711 [Rhizopus delemar]